MYFIPHWKNKENSLDEDRMLNIIFLFKENNLAVNVLSIDYLPYFRYLLNDYQLHDVGIVSLFDVLQQVNVQNGFPMTTEDIYFADDVEQIYTPFGITLIKNNLPFGEVRFEKHGFIESIQYIQEANCKEIYDDRGFLSSIEFFNSKSKKWKTEYYNPLGQMMVCEYFDPEYHIELYNSELNLSQKKYNSFAEIFAELFNQKLLHLEDEPLIGDIWNSSLNFIENLNTNPFLISIFSTQQHIYEYDLHQQEVLFQKSTCIVTDSVKQKEKLEISQHKLQINPSSEILNIPMYPTQLMLGNSNSVEQLIIYWKNEHTTAEEMFLVELFTNLLIEEPLYALILEVNTFEQKENIQHTQRDMIDSFFNIDSYSEEYQKVAEYLDAKKTHTLMKSQDDAVKELKLLPIWRQYVRAAETYDRIEFRIRPNIKKVQLDFSVSRLYIDLNNTVDLQKQSFAVNAGIPLILKEPSDYVVHLGNGYVVDHISELAEAIPFYMDGLKNWNETLVENVAMIETNSSYNLLKKWRKLFDEYKEEN